MSEFPFPPDQNEITWLTVAIHMSLLLVGLTPFLALWWHTKREINSLDIHWGILALITCPIWYLALYRYLPETAKPFLIGYLFFFFLTCSAYIITIISRKHNKKKSSSVGVFFASLFSLGFLILCLVPATPQAREAARRTACMNNLKHVGLANLMHYDETGHYLKSIQTQNAGPPVSWRVVQEKYLDSKLDRQYDTSQPWDSETNLKLSKIDNFILNCPSRIDYKNGHGQVLTDYSRIVGKDTPFDKSNKKTIADFPNGTSSVILTMEASGANIIWTEPRDVELTEQSLGINLPGNRSGHSKGIGSSFHTGGVNINLLDGSTRFLSNDTDKDVLKKMVLGQKVEIEQID